VGKVTALMMDTITEKSGHTLVPNAVSVCLTPAAPSPLPIPYPVVSSIGEGITDPPMRTKINGAKIATTGSVAKACHGNEPGTLKEVLSLNTAGPCFIIVGAPIVICELGMMGITGSLCISNKAVTVGAGANASGAGGAAGGGGGGGGGGSPNADAGDGPDPSNGGGAGGDGTNTGASATPATPTDRYCPDKNKKAPPPFADHIEDMDLRNHQNEVINHGNAQGRKAARQAMFGQPGGATSTKGQAFWSGGDQGMAAARDAGFTIQEDGGGAGGLDKMGKAGQLPDWDKDDKAGSGSKITNERLWKTISRRSAQNANGTVDAFVIGKAHSKNVFSTVELPTLLHNDKVNEINFRDPTHTPPPAPVVQSWKRNPKDGCWEGGPVPPGPVPPPGSSFPQVQGFQLHPTNGIHRFP
jgi:hypothetical protein